MKTIEFKVSADLKDTFNNKVNRLKKTASKHSIELYCVYSDMIIEKRNKSLVSYYIAEIMVSEYVIQYKDYDYLATLKKVEKGNMIFTNNDTFDFSSYFESNFYCDHCKTNRNRKTVHLFQDKTGKILQVASTCAKEYFGISIADKLASVLKIEEIFIDLEEEFTESYGKYYDDIEFVIGKAFYAICNDKRYYSKNKPDNSGCTTLDFVNALLPAKIDDYADVLKQFDFDAFYDYWQAKVKKDRSVFNNNVILSLTSVDYKAGIVVYSVFDYILNATELIQKKETKVTKNEHFGAIKDKIDFEGEIIKTGSYETQYGITFIYTIQSSEGIIFVWSTNKEFKTGLKGNIKGTIKEHTEYKGLKQTKITRCKIVEKV
jgi:hypothetical protein